MMMQVIVIGNYENVMKTVRVMLMVMREGGAMDEWQMQKKVSQMFSLYMYITAQ